MYIFKPVHPGIAISVSDMISEIINIYFESLSLTKTKT